MFCPELQIISENGGFCSGCSESKPCKLHQAQEEDAGNESDTSLDSGSTSGPNFNYILNMPLWCLTKEKVEELLKQKDLKVFRWDLFFRRFRVRL